MTEMEKKEKSNGSSDAGSGGGAWLMGASAEGSSIGGEKRAFGVIPCRTLLVCTTSRLTRHHKRPWQLPHVSLGSS